MNKKEIREIILTSDRETISRTLKEYWEKNFKNSRSVSFFEKTPNEPNFEKSSNENTFNKKSSVNEEEINQIFGIKDA
jgi:hypothetical protein